MRRMISRAREPMATQGKIPFRYHGTTTSYHTILGKKRIHHFWGTLYFLKNYYYGYPFQCKLSPKYHCTEILVFKTKGKNLDLIMPHRGNRCVVFSSFCVQGKDDSTTIATPLVRRRTILNPVWSNCEF